MFLRGPIRGRDRAGGHRVGLRPGRGRRPDPRRGGPGDGAVMLASMAKRLQSRFRTSPCCRCSRPPSASSPSSWAQGRRGTPRREGVVHHRRGRGHAVASIELPALKQVLASRLGMTPGPSPVRCALGPRRGWSAWTVRCCGSPTSRRWTPTPAAIHRVSRHTHGAHDLGQGRSPRSVHSVALVTPPIAARKRTRCSLPVRADRPHPVPGRPNLLTFGCAAPRVTAGRTPRPRRCRTCWSTSNLGIGSTRPRSCATRVRPAFRRARPFDLFTT